jgi:hypothetical protein
MNRPSIDPGVAASILGAAPARIAARLDADPAMAEQWEWNDEGNRWVVRAGTETVTIDVAGAVISSADAISCTCLLSPRCLHVLAVTSRLDAVPEDGEGSGESTTETSTGEVLDDGVPDMSDEQRRAAENVWTAGVRALMSGATATGTVNFGELLRAAHTARTLGLHRLAGATTRLVGHLRALIDDRPEFDLSMLARSLEELLYVSHVLAGRGGAPRLADIGTARRAYRPAPATELRGICTEPIVTATGYAGVVTHVVGSNGRLLSVPDVMPGGPERAGTAYGAAVKLGETSIRHTELGRTRLATQRLSVSDDGRLGGGGGVQAAVIGSSTWEDPVMDALWDEPVAEQVRRAADLVFVRGVVIGATPRGLVLGTPETMLHVVAPSHHEVLAYRENLSLLAGATGAELQLVGRPVLSTPRTMTAIAAHFAPEGVASLPNAWVGIVNLGLDRLSSAHVPAGDRRNVPVPGTGPGVDLTNPLERRLQRLVMGGWATLGNAAARGVDGDIRRLAEMQLHTGAALLRSLHQAVLTSERAVSGEGLQPTPDAVARAWLAAAIYARAARDSVVRAAWAA